MFERIGISVGDVPYANSISYRVRFSVSLRRLYLVLAGDKPQPYAECWFRSKLAPTIILSSKPLLCIDTIRLKLQLVSEILYGCMLKIETVKSVTDLELICKGNLEKAKAPAATPFRSFTCQDASSPEILASKEFWLVYTLALKLIVVMYFGIC
jgi:hypothetical protein